jgi:hypothetical protein
LIKATRGRLARDLFAGREMAAEFQDKSLLEGEDPNLTTEILKVVGEEWLKAGNTRLGGHSPQELIGTPEEFRVRLVLRSIKSADLS